MRWLYRVFFLLTIIGLAILAVQPYLPKIEREVAHVYDTWKSIREGRGLEVINEDPEPKAVEAPVTRGRSLVTPELPHSETLKAEPAKDSFILEARRRAKEDPPAAMDWLQSQHSGSERLRGMLEVVALWAAEDSESALLWLESNAQGLARLETLNNGVELWAERNPPSRLPSGSTAWPTTAVKPSPRKRLPQSGHRPSQLLPPEWVGRLYPSGPVQEKAKEALVQSWVIQDAKAASVWALAEAEFNGDDDLLGETILEFSKQSPEEAESFCPRSSPGQLLRDSGRFPRNGPRRGRPRSHRSNGWLSMAPTDPIYSAE